MVVLDKTIDVACAPSRVFALLARPEEAPSWQPWTPAARALDEATFRMVHEVCGLRLAWIGRAEADPVRRLSFAQEKGDFAAMEGRWEVSGGEAASQVRLRMRVELPFVLPRLLTEVEIQRGLSRNLDEALFNLKALLEPAAPRERAGSGLPRAAPAR